MGLQVMSSQVFKSHFHFETNFKSQGSPNFWIKVWGTKTCPDLVILIPWKRIKSTTSSCITFPKQTYVAKNLVFEGL
jgi:hypothetical protein